MTELKYLGDAEPIMNAIAIVSAAVQGDDYTAGALLGIIEEESPEMMGDMVSFLAGTLSGFVDIIAQLQGVDPVEFWAFAAKTFASVAVGEGFEYE